MFTGILTLKSITLLLLFREVRVLDNGLVLTPPMGWMSWGYYQCNVDCEKKPELCLNEDLIISVVDEFYMNGYQEAGYEYIIIDDCWSEKRRDGSGRLVPDKKRFPKGMKYIADYIHERGLKFGMYSSAGSVTCMQYPGSQGHLKMDADTFAMWDVDYVKFDGCFVDEPTLNTVYIEFGKYLNKTGRPMVYSCSWPYYIEFIHHKMPDYTAVAKHCNLWRNFHDVFNIWANVEYIIAHFQKHHRRMAGYMGPGQWNDPDMLMVGGGVLTEGQSRVQMSVFAMLSAPLIMSCDMKKVSRHDRELLLNQELVAIAQDRLAVQAVPHVIKGTTLTMWVKRHLPIKGNQFYSYSFVFVNFGGDQQHTSFVPGDHGLNSTSGYTVMDVFTKKYLYNITLLDSMDVAVSPEGVLSGETGVEQVGGGLICRKQDRSKY